MPTAYTAAVANGEITELKPFVMRLARGMGALVTMRDEPVDAPIPERLEPSNWHAEKLAAALAERDATMALSDGECFGRAAAAAVDFDRRRGEWIASKTETRKRYQDMIDKVTNWHGAPEGIREFALDQLRDSQQFDCPSPPVFHETRPSTDGEEWRLAQLERLSRDIAYHTKQHAEEVERTTQRNIWLSRLRRSLDDAEHNGASA